MSEHYENQQDVMRRAEAPYLEPPEAETEECPDCEGTGCAKDEDGERCACEEHECERCDGTGEVLVSDREDDDSEEDDGGNYYGDED